MCLPSDALLLHLPSYLGFSYLGRGVSLHGCSSKAQPLLLTLDEGYLLTATPPDLERGVAPLSPPAQILRDDAVKVLHSICQKIWKTQKWPQDRKRSFFITITKKGNAKECSNYHTIALISHTSKVVLKNSNLGFSSM